jgi:enamine deaminase RidA (YjgF/YER057c/UK114 family)
MTRQLISSGSPFEEVMGYSRAVVDGDWIFVSGTTGFKDGAIAEDTVTQAETAFGTIKEALAKAGASIADAVRVVVYLTEVEDFQSIAKVLGNHLREVKPANSTVIVKALVDPRMKVEIEITALKRR